MTLTQARPSTYQLMDAVNGSVVLVTEPLHAFKAAIQGVSPLSWAREPCLPLRLL